MSAGVRAWRKLGLILEMIKFEHTLFALPFALSSLTSAAVSKPRVTRPMSSWIDSRCDRRPSFVSRTSEARAAKASIDVSRDHCTSLPIAM